MSQAETISASNSKFDIVVNYDGKRVDISLYSMSEINLFDVAETICNDICNSNGVAWYAKNSNEESETEPSITVAVHSKDGNVKVFKNLCQMPNSTSVLVELAKQIKF